MIKGISACSAVLRGYSLEDALGAIAQAGYTGVELAAMPGWCEHVSEPVSGQGCKVLRNRLRRFGLKPVAISAHRDFTQRQNLASLCTVIECAAFIGCDIVVTSPGPAECEKEQRLFALEELDRCCARNGVTLALEPHGPLGSGALLDGLLGALDTPHIGICYDTANVLYFGGAAPMEDIGAVLDRTAHVHIKDKIGGQGTWNFPPPGQGELPLPDIVRKLKNSEYDGYLSVEIEYTPDSERDYGELYGDLKQALAYLAALA